MVKNIITKKAKGNVTSLIYGQMFMLLLTVWCLFSFRLSMLNTTFNYIDDALTSSCLGGALVNVEEYGKTNQLVIHNSDIFDKVSVNASSNGWELWEADILLSESNYNSDIVSKYTDLDYKKSIKKSIRTEQEDNYKDYYLIQSLSSFLGNIKYNLSNGENGGDIDVENKLSTVKASTYLSNQLTIKEDVIGKSFLKNYIVDDIEITRFDIYNVYKHTFADRHKYLSPYINWVNDDTAVWTGPKTEAEFQSYFNSKYDINNFQSGSIASFYNQKLSNWKKDLEVFNQAQSGNRSLIVYVDTGVTYQGGFNPDKYNYKYLFTSPTDSVKLVEGQRAGIDAYSVYSYRSSNSQHNYIPGTTYTYKEDADVIKIQGGKMDGCEIENTSIYVEMVFTVKTFPGKLGDIAPDKKVTVARLIDIELSTEN